MSMEEVWLIIFLVIGCMSNFATMTTGMSDKYGWALLWEWVSVFCYICCFIILLTGL